MELEHAECFSRSKRYNQQSIHRNLDSAYIYIYSIRLQCDVVNFSMLWYSFDFFEDQPEEVERCFQPRDGFFAATLAMQIALDHPRDVHRLDLLE